MERTFDLVAVARVLDFAAAALDLALRPDGVLEVLFALRTVAPAFAEGAFVVVEAFFAATGFLVFEVLAMAVFPVI